jgi:hypothetical protein
MPPVQTQDCRKYITPEMLQSPIATLLIPEAITPQREMYEQYLLDLKNKGLNDEDHKALIAALNRCWNDQRK